MPLTASEQISYSTVRIECEYNDGTKGTGTGFFFNFLENGDSHVPVIITNKHVIANSKKGHLIMTKTNEKGEPLDRQHYHIFYDNFETFWVKHPDDDVDLCAIPIANFILEAKEKNENLFYIPLNKEILPTDEILEEINALEEILMVGYPNGIWDSVNNKPIFRKGITASHPKLDYCGKKEIIIDAACFPGSSGSPVFIFNEGVFKSKNGSLSSGNRIILLGVLYAGPQHTAQGEIGIINIPTVQKPISILKIPNNLGLIIKAERILELEQLFK